MTQTVLVTGGAGYIGSVVCEQLLAQSYRVVVLDNLSTGHKEALHPDAAFVLGDVGDRRCLDLVLEHYAVEAVVHLAAKMRIPESIADPASFYGTNLVGGLTLADALVAHGLKRIVFSSSSAVYGEPAHLPLDEHNPARPVSAYGETKLSFENALRWYAEAYGLRATALRFFNAAGASENYGEAHLPETHILPCALRAALSGGETQINGDDYATPDGTCIRDFVHVVDLAEAHIRALEAPAPAGFCAFNIGSGCGYSVLEALQAVEEVTGRKLKRTVLPRRAGDPSRLVASSDQAARELGWRPRRQSLPEILESAWRWLLAHPRGYAR